MRKISIYILLILTATTLFISCNKEGSHDEMIWDITPVNISFFVTNRAGDDLLSPITEGNITKNDIKVIFEGKECPIDKDMSQTRYYMARFRGLMTSKYGNNYLLTFGEFDGAEDHSKSFVIDWGDGTTDEISFHHQFGWHKNEPKMETEIYLNNKKMDGVFSIIK